MSSSSDVAGARKVVAAAQAKGGQLTSAETASILGGGGYNQAAGANPQTLRDYVNSIGRTLSSDNNAVYMNGSGYAFGNVPGTRFDSATGTHYVTDPNAVNSIYGIGADANSTQQAPRPQQIPRPEEERRGLLTQQPDMSTDYINQLKEAQKRSRYAALDKAKSSALSALDTERANISPAYYDARNQAAANSEVGAMNFANYMAARGIKGAAGAMPEIYRNAGLQGQIGALDRAEAADLSAIERQRANVETGYASDMAAAEADIETQAMQAAINQWNADRQYALQQAAQDWDIKKGTESLANDKADAAKQEWISTIGRYANDYQAQIDAVQNDGDPSNDWQIAYLQAARQKKLAGLEAAAAEAAQQEFENQLALQKATKTSSGGGGGNIGSTATVDNPFGQQNSNQIYGYDVSRLDAYIDSHAASYGNDPNKLLSFIQNNTQVEANFKNALIKRLQQRAG